MNVSVANLRAMTPEQRRAVVKADAAAACARKGERPGATPRAEWVPTAPAVHVNSEKVLALIRAGHHTTAEIKRNTSMGLSSIHQALIHLLEQGTITSSRNGKGGNRQFIRYEDAK